MSKFLELVNEKKSQLSDMPAFSIMDYFRKEFDGMDEYVNLNRRSKGSGMFENRAYIEISEQAFLDGIKRKDGSKLSANDVGNYLSRVRKERNEPKQPRKSKTDNLMCPFAGGGVPAPAVVPGAGTGERVAPITITPRIKAEKPVPAVVVAPRVEPVAVVESPASPEYELDAQFDIEENLRQWFKDREPYKGLKLNQQWNENCQYLYNQCVAMLINEKSQDTSRNGKLKMSLTNYSKKLSYMIDGEHFSTYFCLLHGIGKLRNQEIDFEI
ncbi:hypothetical protein FOT68_24380 [Citrobacter braakii]|nr:hypothetical protein [Citrobacter braakii]